MAPPAAYNSSVGISPDPSLLGDSLMSTAHDRWKREAAAAPTRPEPPTTVSSVPIDALYTGIPGDGGYPGQYPYTRGVHPTMYRSRLWTMRQFAGFGTPRQTNERFKF